MTRIIKRGTRTEALPQWRPEARAADLPSPVPRRTGARAAEAVEDRSAAAEQHARDQGYARGLAEAEEAYRAKSAKLDALVTSLHAERAGFFDRIEPELVRLSVSIAEKVIGQELELRPEIVVDMVRSAVRRLRDRENLRVSVNPSDVERVKEARDDLIGAVDGIRKMEIVDDRRVGAGGCVIESPSGTLDARIRTQIDEIGRVLGEVESSSPPAGGAMEEALSEGGERHGNSGPE